MEFENQVLRGDCLEVLKDIPDNTFDSIVTDPPYGLGSKEPTVEEIVAYLQGADLDTGGDFMGKKWEIPSVLVWQELFRVLKPGGYVISFGGTRTWDLISLGARAAGFEYRDTLPSIFPDFPGFLWMHGQGFPKSLNVSKAIDKDLGAEREVVGTYKVSGNALTPTKLKGGTFVTGAPNSPSGELQHTVAGSEEAKRWEGWGTALKPSWEPILMYRKPLDGTVLQNIRKWGTGGINVDGCRIYTDWSEYSEAWKNNGFAKPGSSPDPDRKFKVGGAGISCHDQGRWPPNLVMTHTFECEDEACADNCPVRLLDSQSSKASRYFPQFSPFLYTKKAAKKETTLNGQIENNHPTKKPVALMAWLVKLVTPENGIVLDPYCGSGSTLHAACEEGFRFTGIERDSDSCETSRKRMEIIYGQVQAREGQRDLFDLAFEYEGDD